MVPDITTTFGVQMTKVGPDLVRELGASTEGQVFTLDFPTIECILP